jgi:hypothetical protein
MEVFVVVEEHGLAEERTHAVLGVYSTIEGAEGAQEKWRQGHPDEDGAMHAFEPGAEAEQEPPEEPEEPGEPTEGDSEECMVCGASTSIWKSDVDAEPERAEGQEGEEEAVTDEGEAGEGSEPV